MVRKSLAFYAEPIPLWLSSNTRAIQMQPQQTRVALNPLHTFAAGITRCCATCSTHGFSRIRVTNM